MSQEDDNHADDTKEPIDYALSNLNLNKFDMAELNIESRVLILGEGRTGKTRMLQAILYSLRMTLLDLKAAVPTEMTNHFFEHHVPVPNTRVVDEFIPETFFDDVEPGKTFVVFDDCWENSQIWKHHNMLRLMMKPLTPDPKQGFIAVQQYFISLPKAFLQQGIDFVMFTQESSPKVRRVLYEYWGGAFPTFIQFEQVFEFFTQNYGLLVLNVRNAGKSLSCLGDCMSWYRVHSDEIDKKEWINTYLGMQRVKWNRQFPNTISRWKTGVDMTPLNTKQEVRPPESSVFDFDTEDMPSFFDFEKLKPTDSICILDERDRNSTHELLFNIIDTLKRREVELQVKSYSSCFFQPAFPGSIDSISDALEELCPDKKHFVVVDYSQRLEAKPAYRRILLNGRHWNTGLATIYTSLEPMPLPLVLINCRWVFIAFTKTNSFPHALLLRLFRRFFFRQFSNFHAFEKWFLNLKSKDIDVVVVDREPTDVSKGCFVIKSNSERPKSSKLEVSTNSINDLESESKSLQLSKPEVTTNSINDLDPFHVQSVKQFPANVSEMDSQTTIHIPIPGVLLSNVQIQAEETTVKTLTVRLRSPENCKPQGQVEWTIAQGERQFELHPLSDIDRITVEEKIGVLEIICPLRKPRKIELTVKEKGQIHLKRIQKSKRDPKKAKILPPPLPLKRRFASTIENDEALLGHVTTALPSVWNNNNINSVGTVKPSEVNDDPNDHKLNTGNTDSKGYDFFALCDADYECV